LRPYALPAAEYAAVRSAQRGRVRAMAGLPALDATAAPLGVQAVLRAWEREHPDALDDLASLQAQIERVYGSSRFEAIDYRLVNRGDRAAIQLDLRERRFGDGGLSFGLRLEDDFDGNSNFELGARLRDTEVNP